MKFWNVPNTISIFRTVVIPISIILLYFGNIELKLIGVILIPLAFALDGIDGLVAKKLNQKTTLGSLLDVLADRITEYMLWIFFSGLGLVPLWAPLIVIPRGVVTDAIRAHATAKGISVYDLPKNRISRFLVSNRIPRVLIGLGKGVLFTLLALVLVGLAIPSGVVFWLVVFVVILNLARGIPVILEAGEIIGSPK